MGDISQQLTWGCLPLLVAADAGCCAGLAAGCCALTGAGLAAGLGGAGVVALGDGGAATLRDLARASSFALVVEFCSS